MKICNEKVEAPLANLHDETVDRIEIINGKLILSISKFESEYNENLKSATIIFSGFNDINKDIIFYYLKKENYPCNYGEFYQIEELLKQEKLCRFEIVHVSWGKKTVLFNGVRDSENEPSKDIRLLIHAETVEFLPEYYK